MKLIFAGIISAVLFSPLAFSLQQKTLAQVCDRINSTKVTTACFAAGRDAHLESWALGACDRYNDARETVRCVAAIADRTYTFEEVAACDRYRSAHETTQCLANAGRSVYAHGGGNVNRSRVRQLVGRALDAHYDGDDAELVRILESLYALLSDY